MTSFLFLSIYHRAWHTEAVWLDIELSQLLQHIRKNNDTLELRVNETKKILAGVCDFRFQIISHKS